MKSKTAWRNLIRDMWPIFVRNIFTLINGLITTLALLLWWFGDSRDAVFVGSVVSLNVVIGIIQELRARFALEKLQALAIQKVIRLGADGEHLISVDRLLVGDHIRIKLGDQLPSDAAILQSQNLEVNEALLTGETINIPKAVGDELLGGSFVVAGGGVVEILRTPEQSFIGKMTKKIKRYHFLQSPIQRDLTRFIRIMTYVLLGFTVFIVLRGIQIGNSAPVVIKQIAALAGFVVPEGLILAATLLFAYGAVRMLQRKVLLQQINATEKLGRISALCFDKTGTLTQNVPVFDRIALVNDVTRAEFDRALSSYIVHDAAQTQTIAAVASYVASKGVSGNFVEALPFSSSRKYGAVRMQRGRHVETIFVGAPDVLALNCKKKAWIRDNVEQYAKDGQRVILVARTEMEFGIKSFGEKQGAILEPLGLVVLSNPLKKGTAEIIDFFKRRGVALKLISGDNATTVSAIAREAGIPMSEVIDGTALQSWKDEDYAAKADQYHIYARILPEQKERLVQALQANHIVGMVGDGANDAMAIKQADLGIAMFEGSDAARHVADIVLMRSDFSDLPRGVRLSDSIITTIELVASLFFHKVVVGIVLFLALSIGGHNFSLVPRNITVINYFIIGFPVFLWSVWPRTKRRAIDGHSLFRATWPFAIANGLISAVAASAAYFISVDLMGADEQTARMMVIVTLLAFGVGAIFFAPIALKTRIDKIQNQVLVLYFLAVFLIFSGLTIFPATARFFALAPVEPIFVGVSLCLIMVTLASQYLVAIRLRTRS
ncbi:HAD-IC family P-type ATPase [bacterium]|nr:HAD-IC family P-type ATPase [bacterium]